MNFERGLNIRSMEIGGILISEKLLNSEELHSLMKSIMNKRITFFTITLNWEMSLILNSWGYYSGMSLHDIFVDTIWVAGEDNKDWLVNPNKRIYIEENI